MSHTEGQEQAGQAEKANIDPNHPFPEDWREFLTQTGLAGTSLFIEPAQDLSGTGVDIRLFDEKEAAQEIAKYRPARDVIVLGLVPVGECIMGTGNPYFIRYHMGPKSPLYRVDHACALGVAPGQIKTQNFDITLEVAEQLAAFQDD